MNKENYDVRRAELSDIEILVSFAVQEAREAEEMCLLHKNSLDAQF